MRREMGFKESTILVRGRGLVLLASCLLLSLNLATAQTPAPAPQPGPQDFQALVARQAAQVTEFDVNGLKGPGQAPGGQPNCRDPTLHSWGRGQYHYG
jgi:hypothetical protein